MSLTSAFAEGLTPKLTGRYDFLFQAQAFPTLTGSLSWVALHVHDFFRWGPTVSAYKETTAGVETRNLKLFSAQRTEAVPASEMYTVHRLSICMSDVCRNTI